MFFKRGGIPASGIQSFNEFSAKNAQRGGDTDGFLLGVKFGFSFRVESTGKVVGAS